MIRTSRFDCCSGMAGWEGGVLMNVTVLSAAVWRWKLDGILVHFLEWELLMLMDVLLGVLMRGLVLDGDQFKDEAAEFLGSGPVSHADFGCTRVGVLIGVPYDTWVGWEAESFATSWWMVLTFKSLSWRWLVGWGPHGLLHMVERCARYSSEISGRSDVSLLFTIVVSQLSGSSMMGFWIRGCRRGSTGPGTGHRLTREGVLCEGKKCFGWYGVLWKEMVERSYE